MKALACSYVWWAGIDIEIENTVKSCNALSNQPYNASQSTCTSLGKNNFSLGKIAH